MCTIVMQAFAHIFYFFDLQSTYCDTIKQHCDAIGRSAHVVNLGKRATTLQFVAWLRSSPIKLTIHFPCLSIIVQILLLRNSSIQYL